MNDSIMIQSADENDLDFILNIWTKGLISINPQLKIDENYLDQFRVNFQNRKHPYNFWVAKTPQIVGWCSVLPVFSHPLKQQTDAEISTYVKPEYKGNGIGQELMKFVFAEIENSKIENIWGFTSPKNQSSITMCRKAGMKICGQTSTKIILIKEFL